MHDATTNLTKLKVHSSVVYCLKLKACLLERECRAAAWRRKETLVSVHFLSNLSKKP